MNKTVELAINHLANISLHYKMFGSNKETISAIVGTVLYMCNLNIDIQAFYTRNHKCIENQYIDLIEPLTEDWVKNLIDDAIALIHEKEKILKTFLLKKQSL